MKATVNAARGLLVTLGFLLAPINPVLSAIHFVNLNSPNPTPPYTNWVTAATNIQDAVDAAAAGDEVVVTNGIYYPVVVGKPLNIRSVNGPDATTVDGHFSVRCVYLPNRARLCGPTSTPGISQDYFLGGAGVMGG